MIALLILFLSAAALAQFFISYCRSLVVVYSRVEVSREVLESAGLAKGHADADEFKWLLSLVHECSSPAGDSAELAAVRVYYSLLTVLHKLCLIAAGSCSWVQRERSGCAHMVGVALDRRLNPERHLA